MTNVKTTEFTETRRTTANGKGANAGRPKVFGRPAFDFPSSPCLRVPRGYFRRPFRRSGFTLVELPVVRKRKRNAFTLIELLTVIAIIGLLASLLSPALRQMLGKARATQCMSRLHDINNAIQLYAHDHGDRFPTVEPLPSLPVDPEHPLPSLHDALLKYAGGNEKLFRCPRDKDRWPVEGASYEWCYPYSNDLVDAPMVFSRGRDLTKATLLWDYDNVHADQGGTHTKNILFADGHVGGI